MGRTFKKKSVKTDKFVTQIFERGFGSVYFCATAKSSSRRSYADGGKRLRSARMTQ